MRCDERWRSVCSCQQAAETILQTVCVCVCARVFADTVGLGEEARGEERRWKVPVGGWRFEMVISLAQD